MRYGSDEPPAADHFPLILVFMFLLIFVFLAGGDRSQQHPPDAKIASEMPIAKEHESTVAVPDSAADSRHHGRSKKNTATAMSDELVRLRTDMRLLEHKLQHVEKLLDELTADSYPTVDQQVAMRRDIDRIFINEIPLMRQSILELSVQQTEQTKRKLRVTWFDAHDSLLNHTNDLLLQFAESDVVCLHNARMPLSRFDERCRTPDSVDVFKPVLNYRLQYMILAVMRVEKDEALVSGLVLSSALNATFPHDESIEQDLDFVRKYIRLDKSSAFATDQADDGRRLLSLRCTLDDVSDCCLCMAYTLANEYGDRPTSGLLLERTMERTQRDFAEQKTAGQTQGDRLNVLVMGDVGCSLETFRHEVVPRLTNVARLKSEFEHCLAVPLITDHRTDKHFRHNVHALSNNRIHRFHVYPVSKTRLAVEASFALERSATGDNRKASRRTLHGRTIV